MKIYRVVTYQSNDIPINITTGSLDYCFGYYDALKRIYSLLPVRYDVYLHSHDDRDDVTMREKEGLPLYRQGAQ